jgi:uncharacterized MAPEG superfamily protein
MEKFNKKTFWVLWFIWLITWVLTFAISKKLFTSDLLNSYELQDRLAFWLQWMTIPVFSIVLWILVVAITRSKSENPDWSLPRSWTKLELHRRYLQNSVEYFSFFFITQMSLVTMLPDNQLHVIPVMSVLFIASRLIFWRWYFINPSYRSLWIWMNHINVIILIHIIVDVIFSQNTF